MQTSPVAPFCISKKTFSSAPNSGHLNVWCLVWNWIHYSAMQKVLIWKMMARWQLMTIMIWSGANCGNGWNCRMLILLIMLMIILVIGDLVIVMIKTSTRCELKHCSSIISQRPPSLVGNIYFHLIWSIFMSKAEAELYQEPWNMNSHRSLRRLDILVGFVFCCFLQ